MKKKAVIRELLIFSAFIGIQILALLLTAGECSHSSHPLSGLLILIGRAYLIYIPCRILAWLFKKVGCLNKVTNHFKKINDFFTTQKLIRIALALFILCALIWLGTAVSHAPAIRIR